MYCERRVRGGTVDTTMRGERARPLRAGYRLPQKFQARSLVALRARASAGAAPAPELVGWVQDGGGCKGQLLRVPLLLAGAAAAVAYRRRDGKGLRLKLQDPSELSSAAGILLSHPWRCRGGWRPLFDNGAVQEGHLQRNADVESRVEDAESV